MVSLAAVVLPREPTRPRARSGNGEGPAAFVVVAAAASTTTQILSVNSTADAPHLYCIRQKRNPFCGQPNKAFYQ